MPNILTTFWPITLSRVGSQMTIVFCSGSCAEGGGGKSITNWACSTRKRQYRQAACRRETPTHVRMNGGSVDGCGYTCSYTTGVCDFQPFGPPPWLGDGRLILATAHAGP